MHLSVIPGHHLGHGGNAVEVGDTFEDVVVGLRARWLLNAMSGVVGLLSPHGTVLELNRVGLECSSLPREQALGRKLWELDGWYRSAGARRRSHLAAARAARDDQQARFVLSIGDPEGSAPIFDVVLTPVHDSRGRVTLLVLEGQNVRDLRGPDGALVRRSAKLEDLAEHLADADARRRRFITNISHELKTPLSITIGLLDRVLNDSVLSPPARRDIVAASRQAQSMRVQVDELLTVARIEAGRFELERMPCDLADLVRRVSAGFESVAAAEGISMDVQTPPETIVVADRQRLASAITNLVSNALKATPPGGRVGVELRERRGNARLEVSDTGSGVPAHLRKEIFERFRQGDRHRPDGSGIGLALVHEIVRQHGGSISISRARGGGAVFRLEFVLAPAGSAAPAPPDIRAVIRPSRERLRGELSRRARASHERSNEPDGRPSVLLVYDDDRELGPRLAEQLSARYAVRHVGSAEEALDEIEQWPPDVLLTNIALAGMSGEALIEELRSRPERDHLPIVALADEPDPALAERLLRAGAQDFVSTPFTDAELAARIDGILARRAQELTTAEKAALAHASFEYGPLGVGLLESDGRWLRANHALCGLFGYSQRELRQMTLDELTAPEDVGVEHRHLEDALAGRTRGFQVEKRLRRADGEYFWALLSVAALSDGEQGPRLIVHVDDVTERRAADEALRRLTASDGLTGLRSRREFERRMARHLQRARASGALLLVDVDGFASVNRKHGRAAGDRVLRAVAGAVRSTGQRGALAGRVHADRFAVLLTRTDHDGALGCATALRDAVQRADVRWRGATIQLSASVGGAMFTPGSSLDEAFAMAENALAAGKQADGGGGLEVPDGPPKSRGRAGRARATRAPRHAGRSTQSRTPADAQARGG
jgi:diguanylate cyclase (GGDEF)-like protein/PAS domain S-box-containing protein